MSRKTTYLVLFFAFLLFPSATAMGAEPNEASPIDVAPAAHSAAPSDPEVQDLPGEVGTPEPTLMSSGACTGTLNAFVDPTCHACNANRRVCDFACVDHGGTAQFYCGIGQGVYCECADGVYDSCGCGCDPY